MYKYLKNIVNIKQFTKLSQKPQYCYYEAQQNYQLPDQILKDFQENGIAVLPEVLDPKQLDEVINYTKQMIKNSSAFQQQKLKFASGNPERGSGFIQTGDKIEYLFENLESFTEEQEKTDALDFENKIALNKIGHVQHDSDPFFLQFSHQKIFKNILQKIGYKNPRCVQSMYIFKNPKIGGEVGPHVDNTFLTTEPLSCMGIWIALHDATIENGCLYAIKGTHKKDPNYFMVRTDDQKQVTFIGEDPANNLDLSKGEPLEVKRGSIVLIHGNAIHYSHHNSSKNPRHAYTLHFVEGEDQGYKWSEKNWMQRAELPFRNYYDVVDQYSQQEWKNYIQQQ